MAAQLFEYAKTIIQNLEETNILVQPREINIDVEKNPGIIKLLSLAGVIKTTQGTQKIYVNNYDKVEAVKVIDNFSRFVQEITVMLDKSKQLARKDIIPVITKYYFKDEDYYLCSSLLASLNISTSAGKGRTGGISKYNNEEISKSIENAEAEIEKEKNEEKREKKSYEHEKVLYPVAQKYLIEQGYDAIVLGVNKKLKGRWNTPDILGYSIEKLNVIGGAYLETVSIEVKWKISKEAIAEAGSHQKLVHKSYLWVNQEIDDIDEDYLLDVMEKGIGLICLKNKSAILHSAARHNPVTQYQVDSFLDTALSGDFEQVKNDIRNEIAFFYYNSYFRSQLK